MKTTITDEEYIKAEKIIIDYKQQQLNKPVVIPPLLSDHEIHLMAEEFILTKWYPDYIAKGDCKKTERARKYFIAGAKALRNYLLNRKH